MPPPLNQVRVVRYGYPEKGDLYLSEFDGGVVVRAKEDHLPRVSGGEQYIVEPLRDLRPDEQDPEEGLKGSQYAEAPETPISPLVRLEAFIRNAAEGHYIGFTYNEARELLWRHENEPQEDDEPNTPDSEEANETLAEFCIEQLKSIASDNSAPSNSRVAAIELLERFCF